MTYYFYCSKEFFTIVDFRGANSQFAAPSPDFDGAPVVILDDSDGGDNKSGTAIDDDDDLPPEKLKKKFHVNGVNVETLNKRV